MSQNAEFRSTPTESGISVGTQAPVIEVVSEGEFLAYALGAQLRKMSNPAASLARVPAAQEGGPR